MLTYSGIQNVIKYESQFGRHYSKSRIQKEQDNSQHGLFYRMLETPNGDFVTLPFHCRHCTLYDLVKSND